MNKKNNYRYVIYSIEIIIILIALMISLKNFSEKEDDIINNADTINYNVLFNLNGATSIERAKETCKAKSDGCYIKLPYANRENGKILGFSRNKDDKIAQYSENEEIFIDKDITLYVISYQINNLYIIDNNIDYLENAHLTCNQYNNEDNCSVIIPSFNKIGYENKGYSTSVNSLSGFIFPKQEYKISKDVTLYPIYNYTNHLRSINVDKVLELKNSFIEIENGCASSIYNEYINYLEEINKNIPFLFIGSKISFLNDESFNEIWGRQYVGMNYGPRNMRLLDVRCSESVINDYYATFVHEMSHSWDFYYAIKTGNNITSESDIINLYNKYKPLTNRPFRDYSYSNIYEFFADMMKYYYFKYIVPTAGYKNMDYPEDIKIKMEKYICISKNNYDKDKCDG